MDQATCYTVISLLVALSGTLMYLLHRSRLPIGAFRPARPAVELPPTGALADDLYSAFRRGAVAADGDTPPLPLARAGCSQEVQAAWRAVAQHVEEIVRPPREQLPPGATRIGPAVRIAAIVAGWLLPLRRAWRLHRTRGQVLSYVEWAEVQPCDGNSQSYGDYLEYERLQRAYVFPVRKGIGRLPIVALVALGLCACASQLTRDRQQLTAVLQVQRGAVARLQSGDAACQGRIVTAAKTREVAVRQLAAYRDRRRVVEQQVTVATQAADEAQDQLLLSDSAAAGAALAKAREAAAQLRAQVQQLVEGC